MNVAFDGAFDGGERAAQLAVAGILRLEFGHAGSEVSGVGSCTVQCTEKQYATLDHRKSLIRTLR